MEKCSICFQSHHYWIIRMIFQNLQFYFYQIWALISAKKDSNIISLPKTETLPIGDIVISDWTTSTAEIMSQPVFCAFCVFRRLIPFTGGFMMWGIINQTINQYSTKHICGQSSVKRSSVAQAQNSLTVSAALWDGEILITGLIKVGAAEPTE